MLHNIEVAGNGGSESGLVGINPGSLAARARGWWHYAGARAPS